MSNNFDNSNEYTTHKAINGTSAVILNPIQMVRHFSVAIGLRSATAANNETGNTHQFVIVGSWTTGITHASTMANAMSQTDQRF
uniref:Uncharacterized protein n=1 Tax=Glossina palpalis gambiensis TaxID=67801 RepID=A0A1B0B644_9MUSC